MTTQVIVWGQAATDVPPNLTNAVAISGAGDHMLALLSNGTVIGWGNPPVSVPTNLTNVVAISAGDYNDCALLKDGSVVTWGQNGSYVPPNVTNAIAVSAGWDFQMALLGSGQVVAWGQNTDNEADVPPNVTNAVAISAGTYVGIALLQNGTVVTWGDPTGGYINVPPGLTNVTGVAAGYRGAAALFNGGTYQAWGQILAGTYSGLEVVFTPVSGRISLQSDGTVEDGGGNPAPVDLPYALAVTRGQSFDAALVIPGLPTGSTPPPGIASQPISQTGVFGGTASFRVSAYGFAPVNYQWYFDSTNPIFGATNTWLTLTNLSVSNIGTYTVLVTTPAGSTNSLPASLNLVPAVGINFIPAISLFGGIGLKYSVQYINQIGPTNNPWITLDTVTLTNTQQFYPDYSAIGQPSRLYRIVQVQ